MAETSSNLITNYEATPPVLNSVAKAGGRMRVMTDNFEVASTEIDADGDIIRLCRLPSNAVIHSIRIVSDDLGGSGTVDCGIYAEGGTGIIGDEAFASIHDISGQTTDGTELRFEAATATTIAGIGKKLYELLATPLTTDPQVLYDICLTVETVCSAGGTVGFVITYTVD